MSINEKALDNLNSEDIETVLKAVLTDVSESDVYSPFQPNNFEAFIKQKNKMTREFEHKV